VFSGLCYRLFKCTDRSVSVQIVYRLKCKCTDSVQIDCNVISELLSVYRLKCTDSVQIDCNVVYDSVGKSSFYI
jgi:hypothetical protein